MWLLNSNKKTKQKICMKKDNLEQFIQANRKQFDRAAPDSAIWSRIAEQLPQEETKVINVRRICSIAAAAIILLGIGALIGLQIAPTNSSHLATIAPEFQEVEQFYNNKVNYQLAQLAKYQEITKDPLIQQDLAELDEWMKQLHLELIEVPKAQKEDIINAIIKNYKTKLQILERVLEHAQEHDELGIKSEKNISI